MPSTAKRIMLYCSLLLLLAALTAVFFHLGQQEPAQPMSDTAAPTTAAAQPPAETTQPPTPETQPPTFPTVAVPDSILLDVPYISQKNLLPTGCELVSAMMVLKYYGTDVSINDIVDNTFCDFPATINGRNCGYHPSDAFAGNPWDASSFGCYPPVVVEMMNKLLPASRRAVDVSGMELSALAETFLPREIPVLVWATIAMVETYPSIGWYLLDENGEPTDTWFEWPANEHCLVLVGYDSTRYYFNDPYNGYGLVSYPRERVETRYAEMGKMAAVVMESQYVQGFMP